MDHRFKSKKQERRHKRDSQDRLPFENKYQHDRRMRELSELERLQREREERRRAA